MVRELLERVRTISESCTGVEAKCAGLGRQFNDGATLTFLRSGSTILLPAIAFRDPSGAPALRDDRLLVVAAPVSLINTMRTVCVRTSTLWVPATMYCQAWEARRTAHFAQTFEHEAASFKRCVVEDTPALFPDSPIRSCMGQQIMFPECRRLEK